MEDRAGQPLGDDDVSVRIPMFSAVKKKKPPAFAEGLLAAGEGFEPSQTESESVVLPLHNPAIFAPTVASAEFIIADVFGMSRGNQKIFTAVSVV